MKTIIFAIKVVTLNSKKSNNTSSATYDSSIATPTSCPLDGKDRNGWTTDATSTYKSKPQKGWNTSSG